MEAKEKRAPRTFAMGDIHGSYLALLECLMAVDFDYEEDTLIQTGDIVDGWPQSKECVEELMKLKKLISIRGNHDWYFLKYLRTGTHELSGSGGSPATLESYGKDIPKEHLDFFTNQKWLYHDSKRDFLFVHGGLDRHRKLGDQLLSWPDLFCVDRDYWFSACGTHNTMNTWKARDTFKRVFIGHTCTTFWFINEPMTRQNITNLDTGNAFDGRLTIYNIDTDEYYQSTKSVDLYPDHPGRMDEWAHISTYYNKA